MFHHQFRKQSEIGREDLPFTLLEVSDRGRPFKVMADAIYGAHTGCSETTRIEGIGFVDRLVACAGASLLHDIRPRCKVFLIGSILHEVRTSAVEAGVRCRRRNVSSLQAKVGINSDKEGIQPPVEA
jgi:hypothetical protein